MRCDGCGAADRPLAEYEVRGAVRFTFCPKCRIRHGALPVGRETATHTARLAE